MPHIDARSGEVVIRIVYDGAPEAGKTTNIAKLGSLMSLQRVGAAKKPGTSGDRTEFFDWLDFSGGYLDGKRVRCQLVSVPGQSALLHRRRYLLEKADAIVYVADSRPDTFGESIRNFSTTVRMVEKLAGPMPIGVILQANKQDMPEALSPPDVAKKIGVAPITPVIGSIASRGDGVMQTFILAVRLATDRVRAILIGDDISTVKEESETPEALFAAMLELERQVVSQAMQIPSGSGNALDLEPPTIELITVEDELTDDDIEEISDSLDGVDTHVVSEPVRAAPLLPPPPMPSRPTPPVTPVARSVDIEAAWDGPDEDESAEAREAAAREQAAREQAAREQAAREQAAREQAAREAAAREAEAREQAAREQAAREADAREQAAREAAAREQAAREEAAREAQAREQAAREQAAREQAEREAAAREQAAREQAAREAAAREQAEREAAAREQAAREAAAREQAEREQAAREQAQAAREAAARVQAAREQAAREQAAREQAAREQAAREQAAREQLARSFGARRNPLSGIDELTLPNATEIGSGLVWPPVKGRASMAVAMSGRMSVPELVQPWAPADAFELVSDAGWILHSTHRWTYESESLARHRLLAYVRGQIARGGGLPEGRTLAVSKDGSAWRLWMLTPSVQPLSQRVIAALDLRDVSATSVSLREVFGALRELRELGLAGKQIGAGISGLALYERRLAVLPLDEHDDDPALAQRDPLADLVEVIGVSAQVNDGVRRWFEDEGRSALERARAS